ncbi:amidohydrolase family protein [Candidatus Poriferisocius sp.]|uniref:amidohydrolase family protein n=1 Tax=Candidatus Poriferisocius sp. TaxID=3101276 RepID=UPI003B59E575
MTGLVDTHVHFWEHGVDGLSWPWLEKGFRSTRHRWTEESDDRDGGLAAPRYTAEEFRAEVQGAGVVGVVHAQSATAEHDPSQETAWLDAMTERTGWPSALIGRGHLASPDGAGLLLRHREASGRCRSVRDMSGPDGLDLNACAATLDAAAELGFSVELRTGPAEFGTFGELADLWPGVTFVLSHAGLPLERTAETLREWRAAATELARRPNWVCKISALCGGSDPEWTVSSIRPWAEACFEVFGPRRCMVGTNWPIDRLFGTYEDVVGALRAIFEGVDGDDRDRLFWGTAAEVYRLEIEDFGPPDEIG